MTTPETSLEPISPATYRQEDLAQSVGIEEIAFDELRNSLGNEELIHVVGRYLYDEEPTDLQRMLKDAKARPMVIGEVAKIGEVANWSIAEGLLDGSSGFIHGSNIIRGSQVAVDTMSESLRSAGSLLLKEETYKLPNDSEYWTDEASFINKRKLSGDSRWSSTDNHEDAESLRAEASSLQTTVENLLERTVRDAGVEDKLVGTSQRVKGVTSLLDKVDKFRSTDWGSEASVADAVDLIGGRIVVQDLSSLERVMLSLESMDEAGDVRVLRKENKFIANDGSTDPYRALHYVIAIPGTLHTVEVQIKTLSSMVASDLYHNAVYKPHLLNLPSELKDSVRAYNWRSVEKEMDDYIIAKGFAEPNVSDKEHDTSTDIEFAIDELDYNAFYDLVLANIDPNIPVPNHTKGLLARFHDNEAQKLNDLMTQDERLVLTLAAAAHNAYYNKAVADMVGDATKPQLGNVLSAEAVHLLSETGKDRYMSRFDDFNRSNNKFTALDLGLEQLDDTSLRAFFESMDKDTARTDGKLSELMSAIARHREGDDQTDYLSKVALLNLYHAPFDDLLASAENSDGIKYDDTNPQLTLWKEALVSSQVNAIATSSILTEVGGYDSEDQFRDVTARVFEGLDYSVRDFLTFATFVSAIRTNSEFSSMSYADFVTDENSQWARDFDKVIDTAIMNATISTQMDTVNSLINESQSNVQLARLQKARLELYIKTLRFNGENAKAEFLKPAIKREVMGILERQTQVSRDEADANFEALAA